MGASHRSIANLHPVDTEPTHSETDAIDIPVASALDLDGIERDLADVEVALTRLDAGTYWTDEVTGAELSADLLAAAPTTRRAGTLTGTG